MFQCDYCDEGGIYIDSTNIIIDNQEYMVHDYCLRYLLKDNNAGQCLLCDYAYSLDDVDAYNEGGDHVECWNDYKERNGNR